MIKDPEKKMDEVFDAMIKVMVKHKLTDNPFLEAINRCRWQAKQIIRKMKKSHQETKELLNFVINERR